MDSIRQLIRSLCEVVESPIVLPWEVVEFLVSMYAVEGQPRLSHHAGSFSQASRSKRHATAGGFHVEWQSVGAMYVDDGHALVINDDAPGDMSKKVEAVLHEIEHYNQHIRWDSEESLDYRDRYIHGKKLPSVLRDDNDNYDPAALYSIPWAEMTEFWLRKYGYHRSPHEVEARAFASSHLNEALGFIETHFGVKKPKGRAVKPRH